jgi:hypothetical protein
MDNQKEGMTPNIKTIKILTTNNSKIDNIKYDYTKNYNKN